MIEKWVSAPLDKIPLFIKEGAVIPKYPVQQYVGEKEIKELMIDVYYKEGTENSTIYEDQLEGFDHKKGRYSLRKFRLKGKPNELIMQQFKDGSFITSYNTFKIQFHGLPFKIEKIEVDNELVPLASVNFDGKASIEVSKDITELHLIGS